MITQNDLKELLNYEPLSGKFFWKVTRGRISVGQEAGSINSKGYICITIRGRSHKAHRLAFLYITGSIPEQVDHEDHIRDNNKWRNLRPANSTVNNRNSSRRSDNTSGTTGVEWSSRRRKWAAVIKVEGHRRGLGYYTNLDDAIAARKQGDMLYGFHETHGCVTP